MPVGISFPFALSTGSLGYLEPTTSIIDAITSNVKSLLLTNRGERVMHTDFGCNLNEFLFEQKTDSLKSAIANRVKNQLAKWLPFISLSELFIVFEAEDSSVSENGFRIDLQLLYGNIPIDLFVFFPTN